MRWTFLFSGAVQGIWLLVDAFQLLRRSPERYSQDELWNRLFLRFGIQPESLAPLFLALGVLWLVSTILVAKGIPRARSFAKVLAIATLWYAIPGTVIALINLFALRTLQASEAQDVDS